MPNVTFLHILEQVTDMMHENRICISEIKTNSLITNKVSKFSLTPPFFLLKANYLDYRPGK